MSALKFNKGQGYARELVRQIQDTVGTTPDGLWGPGTVAAIRRWQRKHGLGADGKVGPGTLARFRNIWADIEAEEAADRAEAENIANEQNDGLDEIGEFDCSHEEDGEDHDERILDLFIPDAGLTRKRCYFHDLEPLAPGDRGAAVVALQNDLFAFGFDCGRPAGSYDDELTEQVRQFQHAAASDKRVAAGQRIRVDGEHRFHGSLDGEAGLDTMAHIELWKLKGWRHVAPTDEYSEQRVRVRRYAALPSSSTLLRNIASANGRRQRLHQLAADAFDQLREAAEREAGLDLRTASSWRRHRWRSRAHYNEFVTKKYGSVREGRRWLAYSSPHETGLAIDFGSEGLAPVRKTAARQRQTKAFAWLKDNAWRFGWRPYKREPWHWEFPLSLRAFTTGISDWQLKDEDRDDDPEEFLT